MTNSISGVEERTYVERSPRSREIFEEAKDFLPDGVTRSVGWKPYPLYWERGHGVRIWDVDGVERLDFFGNNSSLPLGHSHPAVVQALQTQIEKGLSFNAPHQVHVTLAKILCNRIESLELVRFTNSGTEATMNCIHAARAFTGRSKIAKVDGAYHGLYDTVAANGDQNTKFPRSIPNLPGTPQTMTDHIVILPFNDPIAARDIILRNKTQLAAVIVEPMMGSAGFIPATHEYLEAIREVTFDEGIVLIFDEVCSLRAGYGAGQGLFGIYPDMTALGKSVGGGAPIGAFGGKKAIMDVFKEEAGTNQVEHSGSFNGNPLSLTSAIATFEQLTPAVYSRLDQIAERLKSGIESVCAQLEIPVQITGVGSLFCLHFNDRPIQSPRDIVFNDRARQSQIFYGLLNEGVWPSPTMHGAVSTPMLNSDLDTYVEALRHVLTRND